MLFCRSDFQSMNYIEKFNRWLQTEIVDEKTKKELPSLSENEIEDRFYCDLEFGTGGLRGVMAAEEDLMQECCPIFRNIGQAIIRTQSKECMYNMAHQW